MSYWTYVCEKCKHRVPGPKPLYCPKCGWGNLSDKYGI